MALNLSLILEHVDESVESFSENVGIPVEKLLNYSKGIEKPTTDIYGAIADYTGLSWEKFETIQKDRARGNVFVIEDTWAPSEQAKCDLREYLCEGINNYADEDVVDEIMKVQKCILNWKKPKITFAGQSDTGKSTIINELLGSEKVPAKWTPTTSIATYIKHIDDKPSYITEDVWIFGKQDGELWDEKRLYDEEYTKSFCIMRGDISLLEKYGTHQAEHKKVKEAFGAVVFVDSPILRDCDIVDLPGFAAYDEDDVLHKFNTQNGTTDILVYLSRANGFLQDRDLDYLGVCLDSLAPIESEDGQVGKLGNLFIVATHAESVNSGNAHDLKEILDTQNTRLSSILRHSAKVSKGEKNTLLPLRTACTHLNYTEEDLRTRFFTYDKSMTRLNKRYMKSLSESLEKIPMQIFSKFKEGLTEITKNSKTNLKNRINQYTEMLEDTEKYVKLAKTIRAKEPARKAEQSAKKDDLHKVIERYCIESKQEISAFLATYLSESNLVDEIKATGCKNKKSDKEAFVSTVNKVISSKIQSIIDEKSEQYSKKLDEYLRDYQSSLLNQGEVGAVKIVFDATKAFAMGISALSAVGATAVWLTTSFVANIVLLFPKLASIGMFVTFGGIIAIGIAALALACLAIFKALAWKKDLANAIIKSYAEKKYEEQMHNEVEKYWQDTRNALNVGSQKIEEDWEKKIKEYEELGKPEKIEKQMKKIAELKSGLIFFEEMPMP